MRRCLTPVLLVLAAGCWLAAGPGGVTVRALVACYHPMTHRAHTDHHDTPKDGPCFCDQMMGGLDFAVSTAVPAPLGASPAVAPPHRVVLYPSLFPLPASPFFAPTPPPPNRLG